MRRYRLKANLKTGGGDYFPAAREKVGLIPTGCTLLDCVLGGGWPLGRVANIVGDKAVGKTLLAIEAAANFVRKYPGGLVWYRESEAAFDLPYAEALGLPVKQVNFGPEGMNSNWDTIEDIFEDLDKCIAQAEKRKKPGLYIVDSLDALSSRSEQQRGVDQGSYNLEKQKQLGKLFRQLVRRLRLARICVVFVSQVREKIGISFGEKYTRSGGKSLDFYASQIVWLSHVKTLVRTVGGVKRATAVCIRAKCKKNKVGLPFRECQFTIRFGYGMDDFQDNLDWLAEVGELKRLGIAKSGLDQYLKESDRLPLADYRVREREVRGAVESAWAAVEKDFVPSRRKYDLNEGTTG